MEHIKGLVPLFFNTREPSVYITAMNHNFLLASCLDLLVASCLILEQLFSTILQWGSSVPTSPSSVIKETSYLHHVVLVPYLLRQHIEWDHGARNFFTSRRGTLSGGSCFEERDVEGGYDWSAAGRHSSSSWGAFRSHYSNSELCHWLVSGGEETAEGIPAVNPSPGPPGWPF